MLSNPLCVSLQNEGAAVTIFFEINEMSMNGVEILQNQILRSYTL